MSAERAAFVASWPVGDRVCTLAVPQSRKGYLGAAVVEWSPDRPARLTPAEWQQYREGRGRAMADLSKQIGGTVALVEV